MISDVYFLRGGYPPFALTADTTDPGRDPHVRLDVLPPVEGRCRLTIFFRRLLVIPHLIVRYFLTLASSVVLFLGRWPDGLREFMAGYLRRRLAGRHARQLS